MNLKPIKNTILFQFNDPVNTKGQFEAAATESGILLQGSFDDSAKTPRWATVIAVGPDCKYIQIGQEILLPALRWTPVIKHNGSNYWKTDEKEVVAKRNHGIADTLKPVNDFVIFNDQKAATVRSSGMLFVVGHVDETPRGTVIAVGPEASPELELGFTLYYDKTNFFDTFQNGGIDLAFIKDAKIIVYSA